MANPTDYYVDASTGSDSTGDGSSGTPWATIQHALNNITRNTTSGDAINCADTATHTLSASLDLTTYGTPAIGAPLVFRGWDNGGGTGIGVIDCNGGGFIAGNPNAIILYKLNISNGGTGALLTGNRNWVAAQCEFHNADGTLASVDAGRFLRCKFYDGGAVGVSGRANWVEFCHFTNSASREFTRAVDGGNGSAGGSVVERNVFDLDGSSRAVTIDADADYRQSFVRYNIVFTDGASPDRGVVVTSGNAGYIEVVGNIFEGWTSNPALLVQGSASLVQDNYFYNNVTNIDDSGSIAISDNNTTLTASPFVDAANGDFNINDTAGGGTELRAESFDL